LAIFENNLSLRRLRFKIDSAGILPMSEIKALMGSIKSPNFYELVIVIEVSFSPLGDLNDVGAVESSWRELDQLVANLNGEGLKSLEIQLDSSVYTVGEWEEGVSALEMVFPKMKERGILKFTESYEEF
jgi:hypothetical protein